LYFRYLQKPYFPLSAGIFSQTRKKILGQAWAAVATGGTIGAMLWYQGESDTVRLADTYGRRMGSLVHGFHADLAKTDLSGSSKLDSLQGQHTNVVRNVQKRLRLQDVRFVDVTRLPRARGRRSATHHPGSGSSWAYAQPQSYLDYGTKKPLDTTSTRNPRLMERLLRTELTGMRGCAGLAEFPNHP
jgi:hypothetical protein